MGLDPEAARAFFGAQIEAAKLVQRADFRRWEAEGRGPQGDPPDLVRVLRPRVDSLNHDLLAALVQIEGRRLDVVDIRSRAEALLSGEGIDAEVRAVAIRPLLRSAR